MKLNWTIQLVIALCTALIPERGLCFANVVHNLSPSILHGTTQAKKSGRAMAAWGAGEVEAPPTLQSSAQVPLPLSKKNFMSSLSFGWVTGLMDRGNKNVLQSSDLWRLEEPSLMANASESWNGLFNREKQREQERVASVLKNTNATSLPPAKNLLEEFWRSPITKATVKLYKKEFLRSGIIKFFNTFVQFLPSIVIARVLKFVDKAAAAKLSPGTMVNTWEGVAWAVALFTALCMKTVLENQYFDSIITLGATIRGALSAAIYRKALRLSPAGKQANSLGEIVNYMQLDTTRLEQVVGTIHVCWDGPFQVLGFTSLLLYFLGPSVFAGIAAMLVIIPFNAIYLKKLSALRAVTLKQTDSRVRLTNEILQGIRAIKSYNWEKPFVEKLNKIRDDEMSSLEATANTRSILTSVLFAAPSMVAVITLTVYALLGNTLTPTKVFTALALFNQLRFPLVFLPLLLNNLAEGKVSLKRLTDFMKAEEVQDYVERKEIGSDDRNNAISITNGTFTWTSAAELAATAATTAASAAASKPPGGAGAIVADNKEKAKQNQSARGLLSDVNLNVKRGELVAVVGPVGSGKSTLLSAVLGELVKVDGSVSVEGRVAYVPQSAWIPNESLRNVVLFGRPFDEKRYRGTIAACGLTKDLEQLEAGDQTEIGERGVNLSGGQKQRVSIARAVYDDADVYLLDDPLSALDAEVGSRVFIDCIKGQLRGKTRVLVTHQLGVLPEVDRVVLMDKTDEGRTFIVDQGTFKELTARGHDLSKIVKEYEEQMASEDGASSSDAPAATAVAVNADTGTGAHHQSHPGVKAEGSSSSSSSSSESELLTIDEAIRSRDDIDVDESCADRIILAEAVVIPHEGQTLPVAFKAPTIASNGTSASADTDTDLRIGADASVDQAAATVTAAGTPKDDEDTKGESEPMDLTTFIVNATVVDPALGSEILSNTFPPTGGIVDSSGNAVDLVCVENEEGVVVCAPRKKPRKTSTLTSTSASTIADSTVSVAVAEPVNESDVYSQETEEEELASAKPWSPQIMVAASEVVKNAPLSEAVRPLPEDDPLLAEIASLEESTKEKDLKQEEGEESSSAAEEGAKGPVKLITAEERAEGAVGLSVYKAYLGAAKKPLMILLVIFSFVMANASQILQQYVVSAWTSDVGYVKRPLGAYLAGVAGMALSVAAFNWSRTYFAVMIGSAASRSLHKNMTKRVLNAPLSYFESTPVGRLIQRFSKDLDQIDQQLPGSLGQFMASALNIAGSLIAISCVTPSFALVMAPLFYVYYRITDYYRVVSRELKRLDSISRSPIFAHFGETLGGLPVIRSFLRQRVFRRVNEVRLDDNIASYYAMKVVDRWLSVRLELLGNTIVFFSALLAVFSASRAGSAGISLNNAFQITTMLNWAVRNGAEAESLMNSVERVLYTTNQTPQERANMADVIPPEAFAPSSAGYQTETETDAASSSDALSSTSPSSPTALHRRLLPASDEELVKSGWPWQGGISFKNVRMRYRDDFEPVLMNVNVDIPPGASVGIVGRTGSGKSSLFRALLRLTELERGTIAIDGVDAAAVGLDALRSGISIIPQDPVLFSGSIRLNLDPFQTQSDDALWDALRKSDLYDTVAALPGGLSFEVSSGGENFSSGQRQLLCLARALVRRSRVLLLDEATSSVDFNTDAIIQKTIREEFGGGRCTVLTIAHRLDTIMDADKILVMDAGDVAEFDSPRQLLRNPRSLYSQLVMAEQKQLQEEQRRHEEEAGRKSDHGPHGADGPHGQLPDDAVASATATAAIRTNDSKRDSEAVVA